MTVTGKRALVLGSAGQDGSFLVEHLLGRGYSVTGASRRPDTRAPRHASYRRVVLDLRDTGRLTELLQASQPDVIFHFAAVHGRAGTSYEADWLDMLAVNVGAVHPCLEYLRLQRQDGVMIYAGSCKSFGKRLPPLVDEQSPTSSTCLYTVTKNAALDLIRQYRHDYGLRASVLHFFQHESELRAAEFFIPKLMSTLHRAGTDRSARSEFGTLDFYCDWGSAKEYMDIVIDVAERAPAEDAIVATGTAWSGRALAETLFSRHGLDYREHLTERGQAASQDRTFAASNRKLEMMIGRVPQLQALDVCESILAALRKKSMERPHDIA